jgi:hypothetical protein
MNTIYAQGLMYTSHPTSFKGYQLVSSGIPGIDSIYYVPLFRPNDSTVKPLPSATRIEYKGQLLDVIVPDEIYDVLSIIMVTKHSNLISRLQHEVQYLYAIEDKYAALLMYKSQLQSMTKGSWLKWIWHLPKLKKYIDNDN